MDVSFDALKTRLIICGQQNLQNSILLGYLSQHTDYDCKLINPVDVHLDRPPQAQLVLVDCNSVRYDRCHDLLDGFSNVGSRCILLNCEMESLFEHLVQWPALQGIFYRANSHEHIIKGLKHVMDNGLWFRRGILEEYLDASRTRPKRISDLVKSLTKRERQILILTASGTSNSDIAGRLEVSTHTVKTHLYNLFKKLGVNNRIQAINWAKENLPLLEEAMAHP